MDAQNGENQESCPQTSSLVELARFPVDPAFPSGFFNKAHQDRSPTEIALWWDQPYVVTRQDGNMDIYCLHGGAWDRPSWMGRASSIMEAKSLAARKLADWREKRSIPRLSFDGPIDRPYRLIQSAQRPHEDVTVLGEFATAVEAGKFLEKWYPRK